MKIRVKLFGQLPQKIPGYDSVEGLKINLPDGATLNDVFTHLGIQMSDGYMVAMNNTVIKPDDIIKNGSVLSILPQLAGG